LPILPCGSIDSWVARPHTSVASLFATRFRVEKQDRHLRRQAQDPGPGCSWSLRKKDLHGEFRNGGFELCEAWFLQGEVAAIFQDHELLVAGEQRRPAPLFLVVQQRPVYRLTRHPRQTRVPTASRYSISKRALSGVPRFN
jgi:hypothetical protein